MPQEPSRLTGDPPLAGDGNPEVTGPVAVVVHRLASTTPSSFLRGLDELERQGVPVILVPLQGDRPEAIDADAEPWMARALWTPSGSWAIVTENLRVLAHRPGRWIATLVGLAWEARTSADALVGILSIYPKAILIGRRLREMGVRHVRAGPTTQAWAAAHAASRVARAGPDLPFSATPRGLDAGEPDPHADAALLAGELDRGGARIPDDAEPDAVELARASLRIAGRVGDRVGLAGVRRRLDALIADLRLPEPDRSRSPRAIGKRHLSSADSAARATTEHAALVALRADGLSVPVALGLDAGEGIVVMGLAEGTPVSVLVRRARWTRGAPDLAVREAGAWLGRLERARGPHRDAAGFDRDALVARLLREADADAERCAERGLSGTIVDRALHACQRELREGVAETPCWTHGNFRPANVFVGGPTNERRGGICVIGLDGLRPGFPGEDAATFLEHVALVLPGLASAGLLRRRRRELESQFLEGADAPTPPPLALRAAKLLRIAARSTTLGRAPGSRREALRRSILRARLAARMLELTT